MDYNGGSKTKVHKVCPGLVMWSLFVLAYYTLRKLDKAENFNAKCTYIPMVA